VAAPAVAAAPVSKAVAATIHGRAVPAVAVAAAPAVAAAIHRGAISTVAAAPAVAAAATAPVAEAVAAPVAEAVAAPVTEAATAPVAEAATAPVAEAATPAVAGRTIFAPRGAICRPLRLDFPLALALLLSNGVHFGPLRIALQQWHARAHDQHASLARTDSTHISASS